LSKEHRGWISKVPPFARRQIHPVKQGFSTGPDAEQLPIRVTEKAFKVWQTFCSK
jgi:hypothetical protein